MDVLVIEDDPDARRAIVRVLEQGGLMVMSAENGLEAFAEVQLHQFGAIVCDIGLPFLPGKSFFKHLKNEYPSQADRIIFVTGSINEAPTRKFLESTGQPYFGKPFEASELLVAVRQMVDRG